MNDKKPIWALFIVAFLATATAIAHLSCIYLGEQCYRIQMAPKAIVESAQQGTLLAPLGTIFVSMLFLLVAFYALSVAKIIRKLPLLPLAVYTISSLCILRGIIFIPAIYFAPTVVTFANTVASLIWLMTGFLMIYGYVKMKK